MDFLDPKKKRAHRIRLYVGYILIAIALSIGTLILLFEAFGYDVDRKTGEVIQNGLVFLDSHPESARITVNGKPEGQTGSRLVLSAGHYNIELQRAGYRTWKRSFDLAGSIIERLDYAFLFPEKLQPADLRTYPATPAFATQSPDRRWLLVQQLGSLTKFDVIDLSSEDAASTTLALPENLFAKADGGRFELVEWSTDNRHVLLKHHFADGFDFVMLDRTEPAQSFNIAQTFSLPLADVALSDKRFDKLHLLDSATTGTLYLGDVKARTATPVANKVGAFKSYGDDVLLYVTEDGAPEGKALVNLRRGDAVYKIRELPKSTLYLTDVSRYDDHWYMSIATDTEKKAYVYEDVFDVVTRPNPRLPAPTAVLRVQQPEYLSISANTRFIGLQGGSEFAVYDAEHDRTYRYDTKLPLLSRQEAVWMDGHRYVIVSDGQAVIFDYDGINIQKLSPAHPAFRPFFDRDYDNFFVLGPSAAADKTVLSRISVRTSADK